jgi:hypothetical protein
LPEIDDDALGQAVETGPLLALAQDEANPSPTAVAQEGEDGNAQNL